MVGTGTRRFKSNQHIFCNKIRYVRAMGAGVAYTGSAFIATEEALNISCQFLCYMTHYIYERFPLQEGTSVSLVNDIYQSDHHTVMIY